MGTIKILVVGDHFDIFEGIRSLLNPFKEFEIVGEFLWDKETIEKIIRKYTPDIVLIDVAGSEVDGLEVVRNVKKFNTSIKIMMIAQYEDQVYVLKAIQAGAAGFIPERVLANELVAAIRVIFQGDTYLSPSVTKTVFKRYIKRARTNNPELLTPREVEILKFVVAGYTSRKISEMTGISVKTVRNYRLKIYKKLQLKNLAELIVYAIHNGLVNNLK